MAQEDANFEWWFNLINDDHNVGPTTAAASQAPGAVHAQLRDCERADGANQQHKTTAPSTQQDITVVDTTDMSAAKRQKLKSDEPDEDAQRLRSPLCRESIQSGTPEADLHSQTCMRDDNGMYEQDNPVLTNRSFLSDTCLQGLVDVRPICAEAVKRPRLVLKSRRDSSQVSEVGHIVTRRTAGKKGLVDVRPLCTFAQQSQSINVGDQCWSEVENNSVPDVRECGKPAPVPVSEHGGAVQTHDNHRFSDAQLELVGARSSIGGNEEVVSCVTHVRATSLFNSSNDDDAMSADDGQRENKCCHFGVLHGKKKRWPATKSAVYSTDADQDGGHESTWSQSSLYVRKMRLLRKLSAFKPNGPVVSRRDFRRVRVVRMKFGFLNW